MTIAATAFAALLAACAARDRGVPAETPVLEAGVEASPVLAADSPRSGFRTGGAPTGAALGAALFARNCAGCHGDDGTGGGRYWGSTLEPAPPSLVAGGAAAARSDDDLAAAIANGRHAGAASLCPPWGETLTPGEIRAVVAHLRAPR